MAYEDTFGGLSMRRSAHGSRTSSDNCSRVHERGKPSLGYASGQALPAPGYTRMSVYLRPRGKSRADAEIGPARRASWRMLPPFLLLREWVVARIAES